MLKVFEAFSGVGAQRMALRNLGIEHEIVGTSEIDIAAITSYAAIHEDLSGGGFEYPSKEEMIEYLASKHIGLDVKTGQVKIPKQIDKLQLIYKASVLSKCVGDISIIDPHDLPDMDLFTYSFPCQDLSVAGQRAGMIKGQTRSGLLYECEKVIEAKRPKYLLLENVKNLVGKKFKPQFDEWLSYLEGLGYTNYWQVLNAKDYGVPQNRERVFVVSILGEHTPYEFPKPFEEIPMIQSVLESEVDEKYYLNQPFHISSLKGFEANPKERTIRYLGKDLTLPRVCASRGRYIDNPNSRVSGLPTQQFLELNPNNTSNALTTVQKDNYVMEWVIQEAKRLAKQTRKEPIEVTVKPNKDLRPHRLDQKKSGLSELNITYDENCANVVTTTHAPKIYGVSTDFRIRKMTPLECWRLMGFSDDDFNKAKSAGTSNSQLYKQAGNSIVVPVLEGIFEPLINNTKER